MDSFKAKQLTKIYDANAVWNGISVKDMMKRAGDGIADILYSKYGTDKSYGFLCGHGNNAGDGFATALSMADEVEHIVIYLIGSESDIKTESALYYYNKIEGKDNVKIMEAVKSDYLEEHDVFVECIVGSGLEGFLRDRELELIKAAASKNSYIVSIDIPAYEYDPDLVISMHFEKIRGSEVVDIGIGDLDNRVGPGEVRALSKPSDEDYKTKTGEVFVYGGSEQFHGAPMMAIMAISKFVGSVYFYTVPENRNLIKHIKEEVYEFITVSDEDFEKYSAYADVLLIGPGLEETDENKKKIKNLFDLYPDKKKILDAYAIAMAPTKDFKNCILTPHKGELRHIFDEVPEEIEEIKAKIKAFCKSHQCIIILKGHVDLIFDKNGTIYENHSGNAGMAKGGTGDILSGVVASFAAKNDLSLAARAGTFVNGLGGDLAYQDLGFNYSATDIVPYLQQAVKKSNDLKVS